MYINGIRLMRLRVAKGISQYQVSVDTGIPRITINRIESGRIKNPLFSSAAKLAEYYGITLDSLKQE